MAKTRKEKERAQKLWEERRELLRFGYGKIAEFIVREARQKYQQAIQMWSKGDLGNAELMLREVVEKVPDAPDPLLALGQLLLETDRAEEALGFLSKACEVDDMNPQSHFLFGQALEETGRLRGQRKHTSERYSATQQGTWHEKSRKGYRLWKRNCHLKPTPPYQMNKPKRWRKRCIGQSFTLRLVSREEPVSIWHKPNL